MHSNRMFRIERCTLVLREKGGGVESVFTSVIFIIPKIVYSTRLLSLPPMAGGQDVN